MVALALQIGSCTLVYTARRRPISQISQQLSNVLIPKQAHGSGKMTGPDIIHPIGPYQALPLNKLSIRVLDIEAPSATEEDGGQIFGTLRLILFD
jgi:hypothetical protein